MKGFFSDLGKRHVIKVGIAYLVVAWLVLQLADVIFPALGLPDWSITLALGLLAMGFPVALVLAWVSCPARARFGTRRAFPTSRVHRVEHSVGCASSNLNSIPA
jgi:hypothetical protein